MARTFDQGTFDAGTFDALLASTQLLVVSSVMRFLVWLVS